MDRELQEDRAAELGYRESGARELGLRDWYSLREESGYARTPREFAALVNRLRVKRWVKANPEKRKANANRYAAKPAVLARALELSRARRLVAHRKRPPVTCPGCGAQFCSIRPKRGIQRLFCTVNCEARVHQQRRRRAKGIRETSCGACGKRGHNSRTCIAQSATPRAKEDSNG